MAAAATFIWVNSTYATVALLFGGAGALSYPLAIAQAGGAALTKDQVTGRILAGGSVVTGLVDPPPATFLNGTFTQHYDPSVLEITEFGWLGSWGVDETLAAPPVDRSTWANETPLNLQAPNLSLTTSVVNNVSSGNLVVSYDWGATGHNEPTGSPFNFFAVVFTLKHDAIITELGNNPNSDPIAGSTLYISSESSACTMPDDPTKVMQCGEPDTTYYVVTPVPESSTYCLSGAALLGLLASRRTWPKKQKRV